MQGKRSVLLLATLYAAAFIGGFNENLVNMALMSIMSEYAIDSVTAQWLVSGYMIVATLVVTCMAYLYRRVRLKALFFAAVGLSFLGSIVGFCANSFAMLMVARIIQAVGTGIFIPMMMNTVLVVTPKNKLGTYMSIGGCMIMFGPAFAPVICGSLVTMFGWHSVFVVPIVAMVVLGALGAAFVKNLENETDHLDVLSVVFSAVALTLLVYGMSQLALSPAYAAASLVASAVVVVLFVVRQKRCACPLIDLTPMSNKRFVPAPCLVLMAMMVTFSLSVLLPLYLEGSLAMTAMVAGVLILIPVMMNAAATLVGGRIMDRRGAWPLLPIGYGIAAVGVVSLVMSTATMSLPLVIASAAAVFGGIGLVFSPTQTAGLKNLPPQQNPYGVALLNTFLQVAACIGPSLFTGIMSSVQEGAISAGQTTELATAQGFSTALIVAAGIVVVALLVSFGYALSLKASASGRQSIVSRPSSLESIMEKDPYTIPAGARVEEAMSMLADRKVSSMPVVDGSGKPVGFVSDGDIMRYLAEQHPLVTSAYSLIALANAAAFDERVRELIELPIENIATDKVVSVPHDASLEEVCALLSRHKLKKVPVVKDDRVVGTVNRSDILRFAMKSLVKADVSSGRSS